MPFANYADLQTEIKSFLWDRSDVVAKIPSFIALAEAEMRRLLRTRQTLQQTPFSMSSDTRGLQCGTQEIVSVRLDSPQGQFFQAEALDYMSPDTIDEYERQGPSRPRFYTLIGDRMHFLPTPDQTYTGHITYRGGFCPLSATNRTNWLLERHPDVYLAGALRWAKRWLIDADQDWDTPFFGGIEQANRDMPMVSRDTKLRADGVTALARRNAYNVYRDSY